MNRGSWQDSPLQQVDVKPGQALEVNISAPARLPTTQENNYQPPPFTAVPGERVKGVVLRPNGQPAADAQVALHLSEGAFSLSLGRGAFVSSGLADHGLLVSVGADGGFDMPLFEKAESVVAVSPEGFAQVSLEDLKASPQIQLQAFGRIEGTLRIGHHLGTNETVNIAPRGQGWVKPSAQRTGDTNRAVRAHLAPLIYNNQAFAARTDEYGRFSVGFVPPGDVSLYRRISTSSGRWTQSQLGTWELKPGATLVTNVGGAGRTVTGKIQYRGDLKVDFENGMGVITTPTFRVLEKAQQLKTEAERQAYYDSPEVQDLYRHTQTFSLRVTADGAFRAEDVLPGTYEFSFQPLTRLGTNSAAWVLLASAETFTVPPAKDQDDDSPVELGTLELKQRELSVPKTPAKKN
jgi:hypothetical protein